VGREIEALRQQAFTAQEQLLREAKEVRQAHQGILTDMQQGQRQFGEAARSGGEQVRQACSSASNEVAEAGRQFQAVRQKFLLDFTADVDTLRERMAETRQSFRELPQIVAEFGRGLTEAATQIRVFEEAAEAGRQKRDAIEHAVRLADLHLATLRQETSQAEARLSEAREQLADTQRQLTEAEGRLQRPVSLTRLADEPALEKRPGKEPEKEPEGRNRLGVTVDSGVVVAEVEAGSPGAQANLVRGDVINTVNGTAVMTGMELRELIHNKTGPEPLTLRVTHGDVVREVQVSLAEGGEEKSPEDRNRLGVTVDPAVVVAEVVPGTPAEKAGLNRGDIINTVNGVSVVTGVQLRQMIQELGEFAEVALRFTRAGEGHEATTRLDEVVAGA